MLNVFYRKIISFYEFNHPLEADLNCQQIDLLNFKITSENNNNEILFPSIKSPVHMSVIITRYD